MVSSCGHCPLPIAPCYFPYPVPFFQCVSRLPQNPRSLFSNKKEEVILPAGWVLCTIFESLAVLIFNRVLHPLQSLRVREILGHRGSLSDCMEDEPAPDFCLPCRHFWHAGMEACASVHIWGCCGRQSHRKSKMCYPRSIVRSFEASGIACSLTNGWMTPRRPIIQAPWTGFSGSFHIHFPVTGFGSVWEPVPPGRGLMGFCWPRVTEWHPHGSWADRQAGES